MNMDRKTVFKGNTINIQIVNSFLGTIHILLKTYFFSLFSRVSDTKIKYYKISKLRLQMHTEKLIIKRGGEANFLSRQCYYKLPYRVSSDSINKCGLYPKMALIFKGIKGNGEQKKLGIKTI